MADDILQRLADMEVPERPEDLVGDVHRRLNHRLTSGHVLEFVVRTIPYAILTFLTVGIGAARYTVSGRYDDENLRPHDRDPPKGHQ